MHLEISRFDRDPAGSPVEVVERKGFGRPDNVCDAVAERFSVSLCQYCLKPIGRTLQHNVD